MAGGLRSDSNRAGGWEAWTINVDGSGPTQLTRQSGAHYPLWSPDGSKMVFTDVVEQRGVSMFDLRKPWQDQTPERLASPQDAEDTAMAGAENAIPGAVGDAAR